MEGDFLTPVGIISFRSGSLRETSCERSGVYRESDMPPETGSVTSTTLLRRLSDAQDSAAWGAFVQRYRERIIAWCRHWGLQEADAEDVSQSLLLAMPAKMRNFRYDPAKGRFRGWLRTVVRRAAADFSRGQRRGGRGGDQAAL